APEIAGSVNKREDLNLALKDFVHQAVREDEDFTNPRVRDFRNNPPPVRQKLQGIRSVQNHVQNTRSRGRRILGDELKGVVQPLARAGSPNYASRPLCHRRRISRATSSWAIKSPLLASARPRATLWTTYR